MMANLSFWEYESYFNKVDVVVVGAGIVGLSSAIELKRKSPGLKILVIERGIFPDGASTKNAGFACFGSPSELLDDLDNSPVDTVIALVKKRWKGLGVLRSNLGDNNISYEENGGYEVFIEKKEYERCADNLNRINKMLADVFKNDSVFLNADNKINSFGFKNISHLIYNKFEGQLDTGKMMRSLYQKAVSMGVIVLYNLQVEKILTNGNKVLLRLNNNIELNSGKVLIATNGFAQRLLPKLYVKPARSQVLITSPIKNIPFKGSFHFDKGYYYFRNVDDRLLIGGGRNRDMENEFTDKFAVTDIIQDKLEELLKYMVIPGKEFSIERRWSGIMGLGPEKTYIIKKTEPGIYCAVRMGGMGVAIGSLVAQEAAELIINS